MPFENLLFSSQLGEGKLNNTKPAILGFKNEFASYSARGLEVKQIHQLFSSDNFKEYWKHSFLLKYTLELKDDVCL